MIHSSDLLTIILLAIRLSPFFIFSPIEVIQILPIHVRLLLIFTLSFLLSSHYMETVQSAHMIQLSGFILAEFFNGLLLSFSFHAIFAALRVTGVLIESQSGLNLASSMNITHQWHDSTLSHLFILITTWFFFSSDAYLFIIKIINVVFNAMPLGIPLYKIGILKIIKEFSFIFFFGFLAASPIIFCMLFIDLIILFLTRSISQINTYFLSIPIKIMVAFFTVNCLLNKLNNLITSLFEMQFQTWRNVLA